MWSPNLVSFLGKMGAQLHVLNHLFSSDFFSSIVTDRHKAMPKGPLCMSTGGLKKWTVCSQSSKHGWTLLFKKALAHWGS